MRKKYRDRLKALPFPLSGFSDEKGAPNYWDDAYKDFWAETGMNTDSSDLAIIVSWFDRRRQETSDKRKGKKHGS